MPAGAKGTTHGTAQGQLLHACFGVRFAHMHAHMIHLMCTDINTCLKPACKSPPENVQGLDL